MLTETARRRVAALRQPRRAARIARLLWICWAVVVWNVILDQAIVLAGRRYIQEATFAAYTFRPYARMDDWMRPAVSRGLWTATAAGLAILFAGFVLIRLATSRVEARAPEPGVPVT